MVEENPRQPPKGIFTQAWLFLARLGFNLLWIFILAVGADSLLNASVAAGTARGPGAPNC